MAEHIFERLFDNLYI